MVHYFTDKDHSDMFIFDIRPNKHMTRPQSWKRKPKKVKAVRKSKKAKYA